MTSGSRRFCRQGPWVLKDLRDKGKPRNRFRTF